MATTSKMEKYLSRKKKQGSVARNWKKKKKKENKKIKSCQKLL